MAQNEKLIDLMNEFDSSEPLIAGYSSANLVNVSKNLNSQNKKEVETAKANIPTKVKALVKLVKRIASNINATLKSKYPNLKPFSVENNATYNVYGATGKIELLQAGNAQHLSFNIKKLATLPGLEVITLITKSMVEAIAKQNEKTEDKEFISDLLNDSTLLQEDENKQQKQDPGIEKAKEIIAAYLSKFLSNTYADEFKDFDVIARYIAAEMVAEMPEADMKKILSVFFDFESSGLDVVAETKIDQFLGRSSGARVACIRGKEEQFAEDPEKEVIARGYEEQANALLSTYASDPSNKDLAKKFHVISTGERVLTGPAVQEFCVDYVHNLLHASNIVDIPVTFEPKGELGTFHDGINPSININLQKLKKMGSYTELAMTISHEITHAIDAIKNRSQGLHNEKGGGLLNSISEKISGSGAKGEAKNLLVDLNNYCYRINPNERNGRFGELSALLFMQKVGVGDPTITQEMNVSIQKYIKYQTKTRTFIQNLPEKLQEFRNTFKRLVDSGELPKSIPAYNLIKERIDYLDQNSNGITFNQETESIEKANEILRQLQEREKVKAQNAEAKEMGSE